MVHHTALYICFSSPHIPSTFYLITRTYAVATGPGLLRAITPLLVTYRVFRATKGRKRRRKEKAIQINCATLRCWHVAGSNATGSNSQPGNLITRNHSFDAARNLRDDHHSSSPQGIHDRWRNAWSFPRIHRSRRIFHAFLQQPRRSSLELTSSFFLSNFILSLEFHFLRVYVSRAYFANLKRRILDRYRFRNRSISMAKHPWVRLMIAQGPFILRFIVKFIRNPLKKNVGSNFVRR